MHIEDIERFLETKATTENQLVKIDFKKRSSICGFFLKDRDYDDLKSKNFWRFINQSNAESWSKTKNINLVKIFSGSDFSKLSLPKE